MSATDERRELSVAEVCDDLDAAIGLVLQGRHGDPDSMVMVPVWELRTLIDAARAGSSSRSAPTPHGEQCVDPSCPDWRIPHGRHGAA